MSDLKRILISLLIAVFVASGCEKVNPVPVPPQEEAAEEDPEVIDPIIPGGEETGDPEEGEPEDPVNPDEPETPDDTDDFPFEVVSGSEEMFTFDKLMEVGNVTRLLPIYALGSLYKVDSYLKKRDTGKRYMTLVLNYPSTDTQGRQVWLSGRIYYSCSTSGEIINTDHILLYNHFTISSDAECPSNSHELHACLAANGGILVCPDFIGYGLSRDKDHPYCVPEVTAVNALDMVRATRAYFASIGNKLEQDIPFYNIGYSQGGFSALAVQKYIETHNLLDEFNLTASYCGGGPYSEETMFQKYLKEDWCSFPLALPMAIAGLKTAYPDIMTEPLESYFSETFLKTGLLDLLFEKNTDFESYNKKVSSVLNPGGNGGVKVSSIAAPSVMNGGELYEQLDAALKRNELAEVGDGWKPQIYVHFMHDVNDEVVPYVNFTLAKSNLSNNNTYFESVNYKLLQGHILVCGLFFARNITGEYTKIEMK